MIMLLIHKPLLLYSVHFSVAFMPVVIHAHSMPGACIYDEVIGA
jgi:hypothetical protein